MQPESYSFTFKGKTYEVYIDLDVQYIQFVEDDMLPIRYKLVEFTPNFPNKKIHIQFASYKLNPVGTEIYGTTRSVEYSIINRPDFPEYTYFFMMNLNAPIGMLTKHCINGVVNELIGYTCFKTDLTFIHPFEYEVTSTPVSVEGNDGIITITTTDGVGSFEYSIDNGTTWQSENIFENLTNGSYEVKVKNITDDFENKYVKNITL